MSRSLLYTFLAFILYSCNQNRQSATHGTPVQTQDSIEAAPEEAAPPQEVAATEAADFREAFSQFFSALQAADTATLNQFIHPGYGLWVIEQPGAMPKLTHVTAVQQFKRNYQDRPFTTVREEVKTCELQEEPWPTFDCADVNYETGKSGYSRDGCFVAGPEKFRKSGYWNYANLTSAQLTQVQATLPHVQQSVLHTATSFEFHFGYVGRHWRLLFAKLIYPCSA